MTSKRNNNIATQTKDLVQPTTLDNALNVLKDVNEKNGVKFNQTVELVLMLGIDARKMNVRGSVPMPNSTGKTSVICCFTNEEDIKAITDMGADAAGGEDMLNDIISGKQKCDILLTFKKEMSKIGKFGRQLGGKGLMPNPKDGTIAESMESLAAIITAAKLGVAQFRNDKAGIIHVAIGKITSDNAALTQNLKAIVAEVKKLKPVKAKGKYIQKIYLSISMGPSVMVSPAEVE